MKTFFTVKTTGYEGPELGQKDTVTVQIQRYNAAGLIISREVLEAIVIGVDTIVPTDPDLDRLHNLAERDGEDDRDRNEDDEGPRPYPDIERRDNEAIDADAF